MPYESGLDEQKYSKFFSTESGKIVVSVYAYNNGPNKMQITREIERKDGTATFARLGRLSKKEIEGILPLIQEALTIM